MPENNKQKIKIVKDGPFLVSGNIPLEKEIMILDKDKNPEHWKKTGDFPSQNNYALCRCGNSKNKPFCDGSHTKTSFNGTETAKHKNYMEMAEKTTGLDLDLTDAKCYCSISRFCHRAGNTWDLVEKPNGPGSKKIAIEEACNCPSGRLVAWDKKTNKPIEPDHKPSISVTQDNASNVSGPLWVKGRIPVESSDGYQYETRNRVTLCRCGKSSNKPFCSGAHLRAHFNDGDPSINK